MDARRVGNVVIPDPNNQQDPTTMDRVAGGVKGAVKATALDVAGGYAGSALTGAVLGGITGSVLGPGGALAGAGRGALKGIATQTASYANPSKYIGKAITAGVGAVKGASDPENTSLFSKPTLGGIAQGIAVGAVAGAGSSAIEGVVAKHYQGMKDALYNSKTMGAKGAWDQMRANAPSWSETGKYAAGRATAGAMHGAGSGAFTGGW